MTDKEILERAITKAKHNGFKKQEPYYIYPDERLGILIGESVNNAHVARVYNVNDIIFSHEFAKAFWKDKDDVTFIESDINDMVEYEKQKSSWKYHLQKMVVEEEPLKYIERYLDE